MINNYISTKANISTILKKFPFLHNFCIYNKHAVYKWVFSIKLINDYFSYTLFDEFLNRNKNNLTLEQINVLINEYFKKIENETTKDN